MDKTRIIAAKGRLCIHIGASKCVKVYRGRPSYVPPETLQVELRAIHVNPDDNKWIARQRDWARGDPPFQFNLANYISNPRLPPCICYSSSAWLLTDADSGDAANNTLSQEARDKAVSSRMATRKFRNRKSTKEQRFKSTNGLNNYLATFSSHIVRKADRSTHFLIAY